MSAPPILVKLNSQDGIIKVYPQNMTGQPGDIDPATLKAPSTNPAAYADAVMDPVGQIAGKAFYTMRAKNLNQPGAIATFTPTAMAGANKVTGDPVVFQTEGTAPPPSTNPATKLATSGYAIEK